MMPTRKFTARVVIGSSGFTVALLLLSIPHQSAQVRGDEDRPVPAPTTIPIAPQPRPATDLYGDPLPTGAIARLGTVRLRHLGLAHYFALPDGKTARTVGLDGFIRSWDLITSNQTKAVALEDESAKAIIWYENHIAFSDESYTGTRESNLKLSPDGKVLAAIYPMNVVIWDTETGQELKNVTRMRLGLKSGVFSPNGKLLLLQGKKNLTLMEWRSGLEWIVPFPIVDELRMYNRCEVVFTPDGNHFVVWNTPAPRGGKGGNISGPISVFAVNDLRQLHSWEGSINDVVVSPDSKTLATCPDNWDDDDGVRLFDLVTGKEQCQFEQGMGEPHVSFSPDGKTLAIGDRNKENKGVVRVFDTATRKERMRFVFEEHPLRLVFSPNGKKIACISSKTVVLLDLVTHSVIQRLTGEVSQLDFLADNRTLVGTIYRDQRLRVWDAETGRERQDRPSEILPGAKAQSSPCLSIDPKGGILAVGDSPRDTLIFLWNLSDGRLIRLLAQSKRDVWWDYKLRFSPDGKTLVNVSSSAVLTYLDAHTGAEQRIVHLQFHPQQPHAGNNNPNVWISPDLRQAVTSSEWPEGTYLLIHDLPEGRPTHPVVFSGQVCARSWPNVAVWVPKEKGLGLSVVSAMTGRTQVRIPGYFPWSGPVTFSPDGHLLAALMEGYTEVSVRETATGREVARVRTGRVQYLALAADNRTLVSTGEGGLRVWDLANGKERLPHASRQPRFDETRPICKQVILTPDGKRAITQVDGGTGLVWDLNAFPAESLSKLTDDATIATRWAALAKDDAAVAYAAIWQLLDSPPDAVVPFLRTRLKPVIGPDAKAVQQWIAELGSEDFQTREAAQIKLKERGRLVAAELHQAANTSTVPEIRKRADELLDKITDSPKGESLRTVRAIAILKRIRNDEARKVLTELAAGAVGARETQEARAALDR